jgi:hypothetical protein
VAFLAAKESSWVEGSGFSVHLAWHRALLQLDAEDLNSALATYDAQIANGRASDMAELTDASALLWRLQLRNIEVADDASDWPIAGKCRRCQARGRFMSCMRRWRSSPRDAPSPRRASCPCAGGGAHSAKTSKPAQSLAAATPGGDNSWDERNGYPGSWLSFGGRQAVTSRADLRLL